MESKIVYLSCLHDFQASDPNQLAFKKGDRLILENKNMDQNWWIAINPTSKKRGYIPSNYVKMEEETENGANKQKEINPKTTSTPNIKTPSSDDSNLSLSTSNKEDQPKTRSATNILMPSELKRGSALIKDVPPTKEIRPPPVKKNPNKMPLKKNFLQPQSAVALFDLQADLPKMLSFNKGDKMKVLERSNEKWYKVELEKNGLVGFVPFNYIKIEVKPVPMPPKKGGEMLNRSSVGGGPTKLQVVNKLPLPPSKPKIDRLTSAPVLKVANSDRTSISKSDTSITKLSPRKTEPPPVDKSTLESVKEGQTRERSGSKGSTHPMDRQPTFALTEAEAEKRTKIAQEIVSTEQRYLEQIESLYKNYWERLKDSYFHPQIFEVFFNLELESMIQLSKTLLGQLKVSMVKWDPYKTLIGTIFLSTAPFFKIYISYAKAFDVKSKYLESEMQTNLDFARVLDEGKMMDKSNLDIFSLLITPIQRMPRYELLLKDLIKATPPEHPDYQNLEKARSELMDVNKLINTRVGENANTAKIVENEQLSKYIAPYRKLLESFNVKLRIEKVKRKAQLFVFSDMIVFLLAQSNKLKVDGVGTYVYNEIAWPFELLWLTNMSNQFEIIGPDSLAMWVTPEIKETKDKIFNMLEEMHTTAVKEKNLGCQDPKERKGIYTFPWGGKYNGIWKLGNMNGVGTHEYLETFYTGEFLNGIKEGKGELKFITGDVYIGEFKRNKQHGHGVIKYVMGEVFEGEFSDGKRHGFCTYTSKTQKFEGMFHEDKMTGYGTLTFRLGNYEGEFLNGMFHGKGKLVMNNETYEGKFKNGIKEGEGKMTYVDGAVYVGQFKADKREGQGEICYADGSIYKGSFKNGVKHGQGVYYSTESLISRVEGSWENDKYHGKNTTIYFANNEKYEGETFEGYIHGVGKLTTANGTIFETKWEFGRRVSTIQIKSVRGTKINGQINLGENHMKQDGIIYNKILFPLPPDLPNINLHLN